MVAARAQKHHFTLEKASETSVKLGGGGRNPKLAFRFLDFMILPFRCNVVEFQNLAEVNFFFYFPTDEGIF